MKLVTVQTKLAKVASNGQISIGKSWAGRQVRIEQVSESEIRISAGTFVPDSFATFYTADAKNRLDHFDEWAASHPPRQTDLKALKATLAKKIR